MTKKVPIKITTDLIGKVIKRKENPTTCMMITAVALGNDNVVCTGINGWIGSKSLFDYWLWEDGSEICEEVEDCESTATAIRPPLGLMPRVHHIEQRLRDILEAENRYIMTNKSIPDEWLEEFAELVTTFKQIKK